MKSDTSMQDLGARGDISQSIISQPNMPQPTVSQSAIPSEPSFTNDGTKKPKGLIIGLIAAVMVAIAGAAFGAYAIITKDNEVSRMQALCSGADSSDNKDDAIAGTVELVSPLGASYKVSETIDNNMASNLIRPYIGAIRYLDNIFDHDFDADIKMLIAFQNLSPEYAYNDRVFYDTVNDMHKYLFGEELQKTNYRAGYYNFTFESDLVEEFIADQIGGGGTAATMFTIVKNAYYGDNGLNIEVYHDAMPFCEAAREDNPDADYCLNENSKHYTVVDDEIVALIEKYEDTIPVYKMIFTPTDDHYVLSGIVKL